MSIAGIPYVKKINEKICGKVDNCNQCAEKFHCKYDWCCLIYCGESEFCRDCSHGFYSKEYKEMIDIK